LSTTSTAPSIALVDYGAGNLHSVAKALERSNFRVVMAATPKAVQECDGVVLPGAGAFADAAASLREAGLDDAVRNAVTQGRPYLGLCLGLQLLFEESDEHGVNRGLGLMPGRVEHFPKHDESGAPLLVPHIGWNEVRFEGDHPMISRLPASDIFYFVHSYRAVPRSPGLVAGHTHYGGDFAAAVAEANMFAVQFHPEKSQRAGKALLDAFRDWVEEAR
jgi:glutamine amidotransferase